MHEAGRGLSPRAVGDFNIRGADASGFPVLEKMREERASELGHCLALREALYVCIVAACSADCVVRAEPALFD